VFGAVSSPQRINDIAVLSNLTPSAPNVSTGGAVSFSVNVSDTFGVGAVTMFVDLDGNGFWTQGVDIDLGVAARTSGTTTSGAWTLSTTASWGAGTFRIIADARDSDGAWSGLRVGATLVVA
jgi:hypothetical protein